MKDSLTWQVGGWLMLAGWVLLAVEAGAGWTGAAGLAHALHYVVTWFFVAAIVLFTLTALVMRGRGR